VQHFSAFDAWRMSNQGAYLPGSPVFHFVTQLVTGQKQSLGMLYGSIAQQSAMLSFNDLYRVMTLMALIMIPSFLLFRGSNPVGGPAPSAH
jgi:hypothetical protein